MAQVADQTAGTKGLKGGALGLLSSVVVGMASTAPAYSLPVRFARIHPRYLTPSTSTIWMGAASILFYVGLTAVSENVLGDSIAAVGLMIAFYYGMTGFACVWFYRRELTHSVRNLFILAGTGRTPTLGLPDTTESVVVAPDLSNLPPKATTERNDDE